MSISQISVFIESKPGMMKQALDVMAAAGANIRLLRIKHLQRSLTSAFQTFFCFLHGDPF